MDVIDNFDCKRIKNPKLWRLGMSFETAGSIGTLIILALLVLLLRPDDRKDVEKAVACEQELALVNYWTTMNLIRDERRKGEDLEVVVYDKRWAALPHPSQIAIGLAAYCRIGVAGRGGVVRIEDQKDTELARVVAGKWLE